MVQYILCTSKWSVAQERDDEKDMEGQEEQKEKTSKRKTLIKDLTEGSVPRELMLFALPLALSGVLQAVYNMVDMVVVGRCLESAGVSAVSIGGDLMMVLTFVAMGFSNAAQVIISQYVGANHPEKVSKMIGTLFTFLGGCAIAMTVIFLLLRNSILVWVKTPAESWDYTMDYVVTCMIGLVFIYGYNLVSAILRGMGDQTPVFIYCNRLRPERDSGCCICGVLGYGGVWSSLGHRDRAGSQLSLCLDDLVPETGGVPI